jgi:hypothetical protein
MKLEGVVRNSEILPTLFERAMQLKEAPPVIDLRCVLISTCTTCCCCCCCGQRMMILFELNDSIKNSEEGVAARHVECHVHST